MPAMFGHSSRSFVLLGASERGRHSPPHPVVSANAAQYDMLNRRCVMATLSDVVAEVRKVESGGMPEEARCQVH
jgi:hypothetical protein